MGLAVSLLSGVLPDLPDHMQHLQRTLQLQFLVASFEVLSEVAVRVNRLDCAPELLTLLKAVGSFSVSRNDILEVMKSAQFVTIDCLEVVVADVPPKGLEESLRRGSLGLELRVGDLQSQSIS